MTGPLISVVLPVRNGGDLLPLALDSILSQTEGNFELIVVDDGSSDGSREVVLSYNDHRIRPLFQKPTGLVAALNNGVNSARGKYIARMDADDVSLPGRFEAQVRHLESNPETGIVFCDVELIDAASSHIGYQRQRQFSNDLLRRSLLGRAKMMPLIHPSAMLRREVYETLGGYRDYHAAEDRDLWLRAVDHYRIDRIGDILLRYRILSSSVSRANWHQQSISSSLAVVCYLCRSRTGIDIYVEAPDLFEAARDLLVTAFPANIFDGVTAFRNARNHLRGGLAFGPLLSLVKATTTFGPAAIPPLFDRKVSREVHQIADIVIALCMKRSSAP